MVELVSTWIQRDSLGSHSHIHILVWPVASVKQLCPVCNTYICVMSCMLHLSRWHVCTGLAIWLELSEDQQSDYKRQRRGWEAKWCPWFESLEEFHHRSLHLGEAPLLFVHKLKKLLEQAMPDTDTADCNQITTPGLQPIDNCEVKELDRTCGASSTTPGNGRPGVQCGKASQEWWSSTRICEYLQAQNQQQRGFSIHQQ